MESNMDWRLQYADLREMFPKVDSRVLKEALKQHAPDLNAAAEWVLSPTRQSRPAAATPPQPLAPVTNVAASPATQREELAEQPLSLNRKRIRTGGIAAGKSAAAALERGKGPSSLVAASTPPQVPEEGPASGSRASSPPRFSTPAVSAADTPSSSSSKAATGDAVPAPVILAEWVVAGTDSVASVNATPVEAVEVAAPRPASASQETPIEPTAEVVGSRAAVDCMPKDGDSPEALAEEQQQQLQLQLPMPSPGAPVTAEKVSEVAIEGENTGNSSAEENLPAASLPDCTSAEEGASSGGAVVAKDVETPVSGGDVLPATSVKAMESGNGMEGTVAPLEAAGEGAGSGAAGGEGGVEAVPAVEVGVVVGEGEGRANQAGAGDGAANGGLGAMTLSGLSSSYSQGEVEAEIGVIESALEDARRDKGELENGIGGLQSLLHGLSVMEEEVAKAREEAEHAGKDILAEVETVRKAVASASMANDQEADMIEGDKDQLAREARALKARLMGLVLEKATVEGSISKLRSQLQARLSERSRDCEELVEQKQTAVMQAQAKLDELNVKVKREAERAEQLCEEKATCDKLHKFLEEKSLVVDDLQAGFVLALEEVEALKVQVEGTLLSNSGFVLEMGLGRHLRGQQVVGGAGATPTRSSLISRLLPIPAGSMMYRSASHGSRSASLSSSSTSTAVSHPVFTSAPAPTAPASAPPLPPAPAGPTGFRLGLDNSEMAMSMPVEAAVFGAVAEGRVDGVGGGGVCGSEVAVCGVAAEVVARQEVLGEGAICSSLTETEYLSQMAASSQMVTGNSSLYETPSGAAPSLVPGTTPSGDSFPVWALSAVGPAGYPAGLAVAEPLPFPAFSAAQGRGRMGAGADGGRVVGAREVDEEAAERAMYEAHMMGVGPQGGSVPSATHNNLVSFLREPGQGGRRWETEDWEMVHTSSAATSDDLASTLSGSPAQKYGPTEAWDEVRRA